MVAYKGHRTYNSEFKLEVLQMIQQDGRTIKSVVEELGIHPSVISRWRRKFHSTEQDAFPGDGDIFHGAFIYGLLRDWDLEKTAEFSNAVSAIKCMKLGG